MSNELKIFGKVFKVTKRAEFGTPIRTILYSADYGILRFGIADHNTAITCGLNLVTEELNYGRFKSAASLERAVELLETAARRIMRECFEIAGPIVATFDANGLGGIPGKAMSVVTFIGES